MSHSLFDISIDEKLLFLMLFDNFYETILIELCNSTMRIIFYRFDDYV